MLSPSSPPAKRPLIEHDAAHANIADDDEAMIDDGIESLASFQPQQPSTPQLGKKAKRTGRMNARGPRPCRFCRDPSITQCPVRKDGSLIEWQGGRDEDGTPGGPLDTICWKLQHADPAYASKSVRDLEVELADADEYRLCFA